MNLAVTSDRALVLCLAGGLVAGGTAEAVANVDALWWQLPSPGCSSVELARLVS